MARTDTQGRTVMPIRIRDGAAARDRGDGSGKAERRDQLRSPGFSEAAELSLDGAHARDARDRAQKLAAILRPYYGEPAGARLVELLEKHRNASAAHARVASGDDDAQLRQAYQ